VLPRRLFSAASKLWRERFERPERFDLRRGLALPARCLLHVTAIGLCCSTIAGCVAGSGAVGVGSIAPETIYEVEGSPNTPFTAVITDKVASWRLAGTTPISVVVLNNRPPTRMFASKLIGDASILSLEVLRASTVVQLASTTDPFGTVVVQTGRGLKAIAPPADPDTRFFVKGAPGEFFNGIIEDKNVGFALGNFARTLFLFERPEGKVDGLFNLPGSPLGPLRVDLLIGGIVVDNVVGQPTVQLRAP
jgi:hypothetical protein